MKNIINLFKKEELESIREINVKKDNIIFHENEECAYIGIVKKGEINIVSYTFEGREIIFISIKNGGMFGQNLIFSSDNRYRGNVISKSDVTLLLVKKEQMINFLQNNKELLAFFLEYQAENTRYLNLQIKLLSFDNAKERILYYLFINNNRVDIKSITRLSEALHLSREATSRNISELIKANQITKNGSIIEKKVNN